MSQSFAAVAVCGCGHDGRLGLGDGDVNVSHFTLIPDFLPGADGKCSLGSLRCVETGAYHSIALTSTGLYGWGVNENGQLGILRSRAVDTDIPSSGGGGLLSPLHPVSKPTRISFFDFLSWEDSDDSSSSTSERVVSIACGALHSFVMTTKAVYVCGSNAYGQLGLGSDVADVFEWRRLCEVGCNSATSSNNNISLSPWLVGDDGGLVSILGGCPTHISCGTHHTLMAWRDVTVVRETPLPGGDGSVAEKVWTYYPTLLLAAGKGDYGELGYDADLWAVLRSKDRRVQQAALREATAQSKYGQGPELSTEATGSSSCAFGGWAAKKRKERRPEFFSSVFKPVVMELLDKDSVKLDCIDGDVASLQDQISRVASAPSWTVDCLRAMHLHSFVRLRRNDDTQQCVSLHWGCYYCQEVEDNASSIPRSVQASAEKEYGAVACDAGVHAGDEVLIRYGNGATCCSGLSAGVMVCGSGNLGIGEEDSFETSFVSIASLAEADVKRVAGRSHFIFLLRNTDGSGDSIWGFGDNLHSQLTANTDAGDSDCVVTPMPLLRIGDALSVSSHNGEQYKVLRVEDIGAGSRHSVMMLTVEDTHSTV